METPTQLPTSLRGLDPRELSGLFRAHLERSIYRDVYATPEQSRLADAITNEERRAMNAIVDEACRLMSGSTGRQELEDYLKRSAGWLTVADRSRLLEAVAMMMR